MLERTADAIVDLRKSACSSLLLYLYEYCTYECRKPTSGFRNLGLKVSRNSPVCALCAELMKALSNLLYSTRTRAGFDRIGRKHPFRFGLTHRRQLPPHHQHRHE